MASPALQLFIKKQTATIFDCSQTTFCHKHHMKALNFASQHFCRFALYPSLFYLDTYNLSNTYSLLCIILFCVLFAYYFQNIKLRKKRRTSALENPAPEVLRTASRIHHPQDHDDHKQHAHTSDKNIQRANGNVDLFVQPLL